MRRKDWWADVALVAALVALVLAIVCLGTQFMWDRAADERARAIMDQAQARIDLYEAASVPATERPAEAVVIFEPPEPSETPAPEEDKPVEDWYIESVPLEKSLQKALFDAACEFNVDYYLALGVISVESNFQNITGDGGDSIGHFQIQMKWWRDFLANIGVYDLSIPEQNFRGGCAILAYLIGRYGYVPFALRAYNRGYDDGDRAYSTAVLGAAEEIMEAAGVMVP